MRPVHITSFVPSQMKRFVLNGKGTSKIRWLLTCKCPWYILSTQSVADLSVSGSLDFFQTCEAESQTGSVDIKSCIGVFGREVPRSAQSGAVLSSGAEADSLRSSRISVRGDTEARRAQEECVVGPHFYLSSQCADAGL